MHILEIVSGRGANGAVTHCLLLLEELVRRGHRATLVCLPGAWIARQVADRSLGVEVVPSDLHRWPVDELRRISTIVRQREIDVLHTHMSRANFFGVLLRWFSGVRCVATAHMNHFQLHWMFNDLVIANSEATRRYHRWHNFVRPSRMETIYPFIDRSHLAAPAAGARGRARRSLGLDDGSPLVGLVGNVIPRKGAYWAVRAMPKVLAAFPAARLALVGAPRDVAYVAGLKSAAEQFGVAGRILWLGHRNDVRDILPAMDVCIQPSLDEPLGLTVLEAMAAGLPVVASAVGGLPELVVPGKTGILVPPGRGDALAEAIIALVADPLRRSRYGEAGRQRVLDEFSPDVSVSRVEAVLARAVRRRPSRPVGAPALQR